MQTLDFKLKTCLQREYRSTRTRYTFVHLSSHQQREDVVHINMLITCQWFWRKILTREFLNTLRLDTDKYIVMMKSMSKKNRDDLGKPKRKITTHTY